MVSSLSLIKKVSLGLLLSISALSGVGQGYTFFNPDNGLPAVQYFVDTLCQGQSRDHCLLIDSNGSDHNITSITGSDGTITIAPITQPYDTCFRYNASFSFQGYDTLTVNVSNNLAQTGFVKIIFLVVEPDNPTDAGPNQQLCSITTTTLSAVNPDPYSIGFWTVIGGTGILATANSPTTVVTNLSLGVNSFLWHQNYPCDANIDLVQVFVYTGTPPIANAGPDALLCSGNTYVMQANNPGVSATGTWEITCGNATIFNINSATALVANIGLGINCFEWNIDNGPCPGGESADQMFIYVYNQNHPPANAGVDQFLCQGSFGSVTLSGSTPQVPAIGTWSLVSGSGTITNINAATTTVSALSIGINTFQWTINNGPCGTLTDQISIYVYSPSSPNANAGPDQSLCLPTNNTTLAGNTPIAPAIGTWSVIQGTGSFNNINLPNTSVSGLSQGTNTFRWTITNGPCLNATTIDDVTVIVYPSSQPTANAGPDQQLCFSGTPLTATLAGNAPIAPGTGTWTVTAGTGNFANANSPTTTVSALGIGTNTFQWTITNGPCGSPTNDTVTITVFNSGTAVASAGPDVQLCTPTLSYTMQAVAPTFPATGLWTLVSGTGLITTPTSPTTTITNLAVGINTFQWTIQNGPCGSGSNFDTMTITVFNNTAQIANAGPDQEFCFGGTSPVTATMAGNLPLTPATGLWTLVSGAGTITNPASFNTTITGLLPGTHVFQWTISNGPCGSSSNLVSIFVFNPGQTNANAGIDQEICSTTVSVNISANPLLSPATGLWTLVSGAGVFGSPNSPNTAVTGMAIGNNIYQWAIDNGPCATPAVTSDQVSVTVYSSSQQAANAGPNQSICSTTNSINLNANAALFPATGQWIVVQGTANFTNSTSANTSVNGLSVGENILQWTIDNGPCGSPTTDLMSVFVYSVSAPAANAGVNQNLCLPVTSATMAANTPVFPAIGSWLLISGTGLIVTPSSPTTTITGLSVGENIFQWTINNGSCGTITSDLVSIFIFNNTQESANAGPDFSMCTPQSTYVMQANTITFPAIGEWTLQSGTGTINGVNNPNAPISGLGIGANVFRWTVLNGPCPGGSNFDEMTIYVFDENQLDANAGVDQSFCYDGFTPVNSTMNASSVVFPGFGTWSLIQGAGNIQNANSSNTLISNLGVGENIFQWTVNNGPCGAPTSNQVSIFVFSGLQLNANAGPDQDLCSTNPATTLAANSAIFPGSGLWAAVQGSAVFANSTLPNTSVTGLAIGTNILQWTINNGVCGSPTSDQVTIIVYNEDQFPANAGGDFSICSTQSSVNLSGTAVSTPATSTWSLVSGTGTITSPASSTTSVTGLSIGINTFQYTILNGACASQTSDQVSVTVFNSTQQAAFAGNNQNICLPQDNTILTANSPIFPATGLWTLVQGTGNILNPNSANTSVNGLTVGENIFQWTISNGPCAPNTTSDQVSIFIYDNTQSTADAGDDQEFCEPVSSTTLDANTPTFPATGQWNLISGSGLFVNNTDPNTVVNGLSQGENVFQWIINNGPCVPTQTSDIVSIFIFDNNQQPSNAGVDQSLCTPQLSTTMAANSPIYPAAGQWTLISGTGNIQSPNSPITQILGLSVGENIFEWTIENGPCANSNTTDQVSIFVYDSFLDEAEAGTDQFICTPQNSVFMNGNAPTFPAFGTWTLISGTGSIISPNSALTQIGSLGVGENIFVWTFDNGDCDFDGSSDTVSVFVYSEFAQDANAGIDQDLCTPQTFTTLVGSSPTSPGYGEWSLVSGTGILSDYQNSTTNVTGLSIGPNVFQWTVYNGPCANAVSSDLVVITVFDGGAASPFAGDDQIICSPISSTTMNADAAVFPGIGSWSLISGSGILDDINNPNTVVTGLPIGVHVFRWTVNYSTCGSPFDEVTITVYDSAQGEAVAGNDQEYCTPASAAILDADAVIFPGYGEWSIFSGSGVLQNVNDPNTLVQNLVVGENIFVWTVYNGNCLAPELTTDTVSIFIYDSNQIPANAGEDQFICTPQSAITLLGNPVIFPASGLWQLIQGTGTVVDPTSPTSDITGLSVGVNIFQWTITNGPCGSVTEDEISIFVFDATQQVADAGNDQELCTPDVAATTMNGNSLIAPATGQWTLLSGSGTIVNPGNPNTLVYDIGVGENIFEWTINNGPCGSPTSDQVSLFVFQEANADALAGNDQEMCLPQNSTTLEGSAVIFPSEGTWTLIQGSVNIQSINDPQTQLTNIAVGENILVWTVYNGVCSNTLTTDTVSIFVFDNDAPMADAGPNQHHCEPISSAFLEAITPGIPGVGTWTVLSANGATVTNPNDSNSEVTNLPVGQTQLLWTVYNGPCSNTNTGDVVSIFIYESTQPAADAGLDQQLCTPLSSVEMNANTVIFPANGFWSINQGGGTILEINNPNTDVLNLPVGINTFTWTIYNGPCIPSTTADEVAIEVFDSQQPDADAGADQEFCLPITSTTLFGSDFVIPSTGAWTLISGQGNISSPQNSSTTITDLGVGANIFTWTVNNGPCGTTTDTINVFIFDPAAAVANAGPDGLFCTPVSTYTMQGNLPDAPGVGTWQLVSGEGTIADFNNPTTDISGLTIGENIFTWTIYNGPCAEATMDSVSIFIFDENMEPSTAGPDIELCLPVTSTAMNANEPIFPASGIWTLISGNATIVNDTDPNTAIIDIQIGENVFVWTLTNGPCLEAISSDTISISLFDSAADVAFAGEDQHLCEPNTFTSMSASTPDTPGVGTWTLAQGGGTIVSLNDPTTLITDLPVGENCFQWTVYNGPCTNTNTSDLVCIYVYDDDQSPADAGTDIELCTPTDDTVMNANAVTYPATGTWTLISGSATIDSISDPNTAINNAQPGNNVFVWTINNGPCTNPISTDTVVVSVFNSNLPLANAGPDQELCYPIDATVLDGSDLNGAATGEWNIETGGGTIILPNSDISAVINLPLGTNVFAWTVDNGPCGTSVDFVTINVFDPELPDVFAGPDASFCTPVSSYCMLGSNVISPGVGTWTLITGSGIMDDIHDPNTCINQLSVGENIYMWCVDNGPCGTTCDVMSIFIYNENTPNADAGPDQEICLPTASITTSASPAEFPAIGEWTWIEGCGIISDVNSPQTTITDLCVGTNTFIWTVNNGPCPNGITADTIQIFVFQNEMLLPLAGADQFICTPQSSVTLNANSPIDPLTAYWTLVSGSAAIDDIDNPATTISGLAVGINCLSWTFYNGPCENSLPADTLCVFVYDESQPPAQCGPDQQMCLPQAETNLEANTPIVPAIGTWSLADGTGIIGDDNDPNSAVTNLGVGTNVFVWTIDNGPCPDAITSDTLIIFVYPQNAQTANAGTDIEICTPESCVNLQAVAPLDPSYGTWEILSAMDGTGPIPFGTIDNLGDPNAEICALGIGMHTLQWTIFNGPCNPPSSDIIIVSVFDAQAPAANAGSDQELCSPLSTTTLQANSAVFPGIGLWSIISGSGTIDDATDPLTTITNLEIGTLVLEWTIDNGPCNLPTSDTVVITVYNPNSPNANAGPDQHLCDQPSSIQLNGNTPIAPAIGTWTQIVGDVVVTISDVNDPNATTTTPAFNESAFVWTIYNGACANGTTSDTVWVYVSDSSVANANAGPDQIYCGSPGTVQMNGSVTIGNTAVGTWSVITGGGDFVDVNNELSVVENMPIGTNTYVWTVDNDACGISSDTIVVYIYDAALPLANAGIDLSICEHEFDPFNLMASPIVNPAIGTWTILEGAAELDDFNNPEALVTGLGEIVVPLVNEISVLLWTVDNGPCALSSDSLVIILEDCLTVEIPDAFSPNDDGVNDNFVIPNLDTYPNNNIKIFNRWGALIFESSPYLNDWDGTSQHPSTIGEELPVSTYYYLFDLGTGAKIYSGFVYLKR